jgi:hypothetical protein
VFLTLLILVFPKPPDLWYELKHSRCYRALNTAKNHLSFSQSTRDLTDLQNNQISPGSKSNRIMILPELKQFVLFGAVIIITFEGVNFYIKTSSSDIDSGLKQSKSYQSNTVYKKQSGLAVIHMGTLKTGTTTIQELSKKYASQLRIDGYEMPWNWEKKWEQVGNPNQVHFASCFTSPAAYPRSKYPCVPELLLNELEIFKAGKNLFVSTEEFAYLGLEDLGVLSTFFSSHWENVVVVVYYRRYYDWIASWYNHQRRVNKEFQMTARQITENEANITNYLYTSRLVSRAKEHFSNIMVVNMHDSGPTSGVGTIFFCDVLPFANHTCGFLKNSTSNAHANERHEIVYDVLARSARSKGLVDREAELAKLSEAMQQHAEKTLNLTYRDLKMLCPALDVQKKLLEKSLEYENMFFPLWFEGPFGKAALMSDFEKKISFELCDLDVNAILEEEKWVVFLKSWKP